MTTVVLLLRGLNIWVEMSIVRVTRIHCEMLASVDNLITVILIDQLLLTWCIEVTIGDQYGW